MPIRDDRFSARAYVTTKLDSGVLMEPSCSPWDYNPRSLLVFGASATQIPPKSLNAAFVKAFPLENFTW